MNAAEDADVRLEQGLALAAYLHPDAYELDLLPEAVAIAATPVQRGAIALSGARALGLIGRFDRAVALCRQALEQAEAYPAELRERLEAELGANGWLHVSTIEESRRRRASAAQHAQRSRGAHAGRAPRRRAGHGNREIAERLYVTQRTVETHLTHAFHKLDIASRSELAAALKPQTAPAEPALAG